MALKDWKKDKWDENGRWHNSSKHQEISIGDDFAGVIHIFYNANTLKAPSQNQTIKVVKTKKQAETFVKSFMRTH